MLFVYTKEVQNVEAKSTSHCHGGNLKSLIDSHRRPFCNADKALNLLKEGNARFVCGKVDNCQVGVFAAYAFRHGYAIIDKRLHIPKKWFSDAYRDKFKLPPNVLFRTKPQFAVNMLTDISDQGLPFR